MQTFFVPTKKETHIFPHATHEQIHSSFLCPLKRIHTSPTHFTYTDNGTPLYTLSTIPSYPHMSYI